MLVSTHPDQGQADDLRCVTALQWPSVGQAESLEVGCTEMLQHGCQHGKVHVHVRRRNQEKPRALEQRRVLRQVLQERSCSCYVPRD
mmetsp:Transcript_105446/g.193316  ORF Transcript_105446/g.193316 Transcript_105446/m.193316 type:complete len:87 (+) Transcript_105446:2331-2591(+)